MPAVRSSKLLNEQSQIVQPTIHSLNVKDLSNPKKPKTDKPEFWYDKLVYWVLLSLIGSLVFGLLALVNTQFVFIAPVFPVVGTMSWFIRTKMRERGLHTYHNK